MWKPVLATVQKVLFHIDDFVSQVINMKYYIKYYEISKNRALETTIVL